MGIRDWKEATDARTSDARSPIPNPQSPIPPFYSPAASPSDRLRAVLGLRPLRAVYIGLPDLLGVGGRERQPARPGLSDAVGLRGEAESESSGAAAPGVVPRLPRLRDGLPLGRPLRPADRALPHGHGGSGPELGQAAGLVPRGDPAAAVPVCRSNPLGHEADARPSDWGSTTW